MLLTAILERKISHREIALPVRLGLGNPCQDAKCEYISSVEILAPFVTQIDSHLHQLPDEALIKSAQYAIRNERTKELKERNARIKQEASQKTRRALQLVTEKGAFVWLTVLPLQELGFTLNKREFRDAIKLRYNWLIDDIPSTYVCGRVYLYGRPCSGM